MKRSKILFDRTEIIMVYDVTNNMKKKIVKTSLIYNQIQSITLEKCKEKKLFKKFDSERILIRSNKVSEPIVYYKGAEPNYFDEYKAGFRKFAKANRITLYDNLDS